MLQYRPMKKLDTQRTVGITGKTTTGKSFFAQILGEMTGFHVIHADKYLDEIILKPPIKQLLEKRIGCELNATEEDIMRSQSGDPVIWKRFLNIIHGPTIDLNKQKVLTVLFLLNHELAKELKQLDGTPTIVESVGLPHFRAARNLADYTFVTSDEQLRYQKKMHRDNITFEEAKKNDEFYCSIFNYDKLRYSRTFNNDYKSIPAGFEQYAEELVNRFS